MKNAEEFVKDKWDRLVAFSKKKEVTDRLWQEIVQRYSEPHRAYHNLSHIAYLFSLLQSYLDQVNNPAVTGFAILYHDIVYDTFRHDNEEESAAIAENHLQELSLNKSIIENVKAFILATKTHTLPPQGALQGDLALFLDMDMAILGSDYNAYTIYSNRIRQEYSHYPDALYKEGRKKALQAFLETPAIFLTDDFRVVIEDAARENIRKEISLL